MLLGNQQPRLSNVPRGVSSDGPEAVEFAALCGLVLDPWQAYALECLLQKDAAGRWVTKDGLIIVPRQNGKGAIDEAWALSRVFLRGVEGVVHTAHHAKTAFDAFKKMRKRIEGSPWLYSQLKPDRSHGIRVANGEWGFTFKSGQQINYQTRAGGAGRGLTIDDLILDEIQHITDEELESLTSIILTKTYGQTVMTGSAPIPGRSAPLSRLVAAGRGGDQALTYLEWSCDETQAYDLDDRRLWAQANPGYGIRLFDQAFLSDRVKLTDEGWAREHLGIVTVNTGVFPAGSWSGCRDYQSKASGAPTFAIEVAEDHSWSAIAVAGAGSAGVHVEVVDYKQKTGWVVDAARVLMRVHSQAAFVVQPSAGAGSLIADLESAGVPVTKASQQDYAQACGNFFDAVVDAELRHLGQPELDVSVSGARKKPLGDAFVWDRRKSLDISPLAAVTLAFWGHVNRPAGGGWFMSLP